MQKNAMLNTMSVFVPFPITKEIDSIQMTKRVKKSSSINLANNSGSILLQTAYINVSNLSTQKEAKVCVLLDTGSPRSYISTELRNYLKLSLLSTERIFIKTFGKVEPTIKTVDIVQLKVVSPSKSVVIKAICTLFICSDILCQNVHSVAPQYEHLQNLTLADCSSDGNKRIDILVGVDYYYSCIGGEIKRSSENARASFKYRKCN